MMGNVKICFLCLKWGTAYDATYVNILHRAVTDNTSYKVDFICITDDNTGLNPDIIVQPLCFDQVPFKEWTDGMWPKLVMFNRDIVAAYDLAFFLDLDLVITGRLDDFIKLVENHKNTLFIMPNFRKIYPRLLPAAFWNRAPHLLAQMTRGNSSVVGFKPAEQFHLYDDFDSAHHRAIYKNDQDYIAGQAHEKLCWPIKWCRSLIHLVDYFPLGLILKRYKNVPRDCKIMVLNGDPKPSELTSENIGYWGNKRRIAYGSPKWISDYFNTYDRKT